MKSAHLEHRVGPVTETYPLARYERPSRRVGFAGGLTKLYIVHCIRQNCCVSQSHKHCFLVVPATNMRRQISSRHHPNCTLIPSIREYRAAHTVHTAIDTPREKNKDRTCPHTQKVGTRKRQQPSSWGQPDKKQLLRVCADLPACSKLLLAVS